MSGKTETLVVDGVSYTVTALDTTPGLELYDELRIHLADVIQDALSVVVDGAAKGADLTSLGDAIGARVMFGALAKLPKGMPQYLGGVFAKQTKVSVNLGGSVGSTTIELASSYEQHFAGKIGHWQKWIISCLKFQFADFLPASATSKSSS